jgi:hypothetical protein
MPGPLASNRLTKSPFRGTKPKKSKALRRMERALAARRAGMPKNARGFRLPGSENPRKRSTGRGRAA